MQSPSAAQQKYWQRSLRVTAVLLAIWFVVTFVVSFYASALSDITFLGFPLGFYMGAQGALLIYLVIVFIYARYMNFLDAQFGVEEDDD